jgi:hypothetical protein
MVLRQFTLVERTVLNFAGMWGTESLLANDNSIRAAIYTALGARLHQSAIKPNAISALAPAAPSSATAQFINGETLEPGTYLMAMTAAGGTTSALNCNGSNGTAGTPVSASSSELVPPGNWPDFPLDISGAMDTSAARGWDIWVDHDPLAAGTFIYGKRTIGASGWVSIEGRRHGFGIVVTGSKTATRIRAYLRTVGTAANGTRCSLYSRSTNQLLYTSDVLAGFTDTVGSWRDYVFTQAVPAGEYWLTITAEGIPGGSNTVEIAYDTVGADPNLQSWFVPSEQVWPTQTPDLTGQDDSDYTNNQAISLYLEATESVATPTPTITDAGDEIFTSGETGVAILWTNGGATQGSGAVRICPTNNIADPDGVDQTVTSWSDSGGVITVVRGSLPFLTNLYLFVRTNGGQSNATGYVVQLEPRVFIRGRAIRLNRTARSNDTDITAFIYRSEPGAGKTTPDQVLANLSIVANGDFNWEIARGTLAANDNVWVVGIKDSDPVVFSAMRTTVVFE